MVYAVRTSLDLAVIRTGGIRGPLDVMSKISIVLYLSCILGSLKVRANDFVPASLDLLFGLFDPVRTVCSILLLSKAGGRCIDLVFKLIDVRLDFVDMRSEIGLVVRV